MASLLSPLRRVVIVSLAALALAACSKSGTQRSGDAQVAARVNDQDITIHQVQYVLQRAPETLALEGDAASRRVLDQLVEQEIAAQAARDQGLDREPAVVQALEAARREVLARAWQDRLAAAAVRPSSDEIDLYYTEHPALFAQRRLYVLQESLVEARGDAGPRAQQIAREARGARELEDKLAVAGLPVRSRQLAKASEDLPMALVEPMARLDVGQSLAIPVPGGVRIFTVVQATLAPVERRLANDAIGAVLLTDRKRQAIASGMKPSREKAHIEYRGSFSQAASASADAR